MNTLRDLFWNDCTFKNSRRIIAAMNRKGMTYLAKFYDIPADDMDYRVLGKLLESKGIVKGQLPQRRCISVGDGTLVIVRVKEDSKLLEACKQLGFEESEVVV